MALWNNTDREESKPTWLNPAQKINCVRTVRGWELPLDGTSLGGQLAGLDGYTGVTAFTPHMELLVCLPLDPSPAGVTNSNYADRATVTGGTAAANDLPNYASYFSCPFDGDSATAGGFDGTGLSSAATTVGAGAGVYALNKYGVSSLQYPVASPHTSRLSPTTPTSPIRLSLHTSATLAQTVSSMMVQIFSILPMFPQRSMRRSSDQRANTSTTSACSRLPRQALRRTLVHTMLSLMLAMAAV